MFFLRMKRFLISLFFCCLINPLFAAKPLLDIRLLPEYSTNGVISAHGIWPIGYSVCNQLSVSIRPPSQTLVGRDGVTPLTSGCDELRALGPGECCDMRLAISKPTYGGPNIRSSPLLSGRHEASVLKSNSFREYTAPANEQISVMQDATLPEATLSASPSSLTLTSADPSLGPSTVVTITNTSGTFATDLSFPVSSQMLNISTTCSSTLEPSGSCTLTVGAASTSGLGGTGDLTINGSNLTTPLVIPFTVNPVLLSVSPVPVILTLGGPSQTVTITNTSTTVTANGPISWRGDVYVNISLNDCENGLAPLASCTATFEPYLTSTARTGTMDFIGLNTKTPFFIVTVN